MSGQPGADLGTLDSTPTIALAPLPLPEESILRRIERPRRMPLGKPRISPMATIPLFYAALLYMAGIVLARVQYLRPGLLLAGVGLLALLAMLAIVRALRVRWFPLACIWVVLGTWSAEMEKQPAPDAAVMRLSDGLLRTIEGTVVDAGPARDSPVDVTTGDDGGRETATQARDRVQRVDLEITAAEVVTDDSDGMVPLQAAEAGRVRLSVIRPWRRYNGLAGVVRCGERLRVVVRMLMPDTFHDAGVWNRAAYLESEEVAATAQVIASKSDAEGPRLRVLGEPASVSMACRLNDWRNGASARLQALPAAMRGLPAMLRVSVEDAAMFTALLTGDRTYLTRGIRAGFERTGSFHLVVVSGLHLAILAGCVFAGARRLSVPRLAATAVTIAISLGYALFTGFGVPVQRSFWMVTLYLVGRLLYRERSSLNVIGFATLCIVGSSPRSIFDASLQMTVLSVAAIAGIAAPILEGTLQAQIRATKELRLIRVDPALPPRIVQFRVTLRLVAQHMEAATGARIAWRFLPWVVRWVLRLGELVFVTLVVELALALPMAIYFHRITVYALPVNLVILPLLGILLPCAMALLVVISVWPAAAAIPAAVCVSVLHFSVFVVRGLGGLAFGDIRVPEPTVMQTAVATGLFVLAILLCKLSGPRPVLQRVAFAVLLLAAGTALWPRAVNRPAHSLLFEAIDVGQGDSLLVITPDGKSLLVDGGGLGFVGQGRHAAQSEFDVGEEVVSAALWSRGIRRLDSVALTHAHHDHIGGLSAVLRNFRPRELWVGNNPPVLPYVELLRQAREQGVMVRSFRAGDEISLGVVDVRVLGPGRGYQPGTEPKNDDSLVLQARYGETSILLEGDAERPEERTILNEPGLESSVLKVGHHGSVTSTSPELLARVAPQWAVISCGRRNRFGHPRPEILRELQDAHVRTFRTDIDGATCFVLNDKSVTADPMCRGEN